MSDTITTLCDLLDDDAPCDVLVAVQGNQQAAEILTDLEFLKKSQRMLSENYMLDDEGKFGRQTEKQWADLGQFLFDNELLVDDANNPLSEAPDWSTYFTNEYISE